MNVTEIIDALSGEIVARGLYIVDVSISKDNDIEVIIEKEEGIVELDDCVGVSRFFETCFDREKEDMLSSNPLEIAETTLDMTAIMGGMASAGNMPDLDKIGDRVYVNSFLTNIAQGMTVTNDLSDNYLNYIESMDETWYSAIVYSSGITLNNNLFTEVEVEDNATGTTKKQVMSLSELKAYYTLKLTQQEEKYASLAYLVDYLGSIYGKIPGTTDVNSADYGKYVLEQYEVVGEGHFPRTSSEAVLVVGSNNDMTDLTLAQLGFIGEKDFLSLFPQEGEELGNQKDYETMIDFSEIVGKKFMLNYNDAVYTANEEGGDYLYSYEGVRSELGTESEEYGREVTISCILRLKEGHNYGCLGSGLYVTEQLVHEYQQVNIQSEIAKTLRMQSEKTTEFGALTSAISELDPNDPEYQMKYQAKMQEMQLFMLTCINEGAFKRAAANLSDYYMSGESVSDNASMKNMHFLYGDKAIRAVGGKDKINTIEIYTDNFDNKDKVVNYLEEWNNTHSKDEIVKFSDTVGTMLKMVETMLNAITYVLVAFTAISLVVSSVMIGIITYVSVVERVKEIGVLRSLGARKRDIKNLFNAETFIIGAASGIFGVSVTYLLQMGINAVLGFFTGISTLAALPIGSAFAMIVISVGLTLISGLIPAKAAANKDPVVALRTE